MRTVPITDFDYNEIKQFWDSNINSDFIYEPLSLEVFKHTFTHFSNTYSAFSYKGLVKGKVIGIASGIFYPEKDTFYLTMVLVDRAHRNKGYGKILVKALEDFWLNKPKLKQVNISFFNPANLPWHIPNEDGVSHPNMPGVDMQSSAHVFFKNLGFLDYAYQNSYYKNVEDFKYDNYIKTKKEELAKEGYEFDFYKIDKHTGLEDLMDDLNSESWTKEVLTHVKNYGKDNTLIVVTHNDLVVGFTGPIRRQDNGRGYFCGIAIHSKYRSKGLASVLFARLLKGFKDIGAKYCTLFTGENNPARKIYEKQGFKITRGFANMRKEINQ